MELTNINWLAVFAAALAAFMVGGIWYSKILLSNAWMADSNLTAEQLKTGNKGKMFGFTFFFSLLMASTIALFLTNGKYGIGYGTAVGFHAGLLAFSAIAIHSLFELKSWRLIFINGGYVVVSLTLMGAIIGLWQ
jgi:hypothetical protein